MILKRLTWRRLVCVLVLLVAFQNIVHLVASAVDPLQLDYSEGLVLGGLERIAHHPSLASAYSFNPVFYNTTDLAYPPVFPYTAAVLAHILAFFTNFNDPSGALNSLYAARALTLAGLGVSAFVIYLLIRLYNSDRLVAVAAASLLFCFHPTIYWGVYARVDALGLAFLLTGLYLIARVESCKEQESPLVAYLLALPLFWLAFFTKQSMIAAPLAVTCYLFFHHRKRIALIFAAVFGCTVGVGIVALDIATRGNYLFFLTMERYTPFSIPKMVKTWGLFLLLYGPLCVGAIWQARRSFQKGGLARLLVLWGLFATIISFTVGKAGAADYYFFEVMAFISLMAGWLTAQGQKRPLTREVLRGIIGLQVAALLVLGIWLDYPANDRDAVRSADARAAQYIRQYAAPDEKIFVEMSGPAVAAGRPDQIFDHFIFRQLAAAGQRDGQALVEDFANKRFKLALFGYDVLRYDIRPDVTEPSPWPPGFEQAVRENYRLLEDIRGSDGRPYAWALIPK
ncbi:MAG TPA: glycosyltransferase family 39 protein [Chloroflexia bacterium]|nr:glycosyltransferase family 39 protein [Chloroflexia bacterium]